MESWLAFWCAAGLPLESISRIVVSRRQLALDDVAHAAYLGETDYTMALR
jgi:hypothetical protein